MRAAFGLIDDPTKADANRACVAAAIKDGWFVRVPLIILGIMQMFFFHEHRSIGWHLQLMRLDFSEVFEASGLAEFSVVVWSERTPRSIAPLTMMVVCLEF